jgi:3-isopropylmalate/(R)-2-methylmalate dehydratase large subunit
VTPASGGRTTIEKILGRAAGDPTLRAGDLATYAVDRIVLIDMQFRSFNGWVRPLRIADPDRVAVIMDHAVPAPSVADANAAAEGRAFAEQFGITDLFDVGAHGICHQVIAEHALARPGEVLVCADSHTCAAGAFNCAARGLGTVEVLHILCTGSTWAVVPDTARFELTGALSSGVAAKDLFLHLAGTYGSAENRAVEFSGPGRATLRLAERRVLATQGAELLADYTLFPCDEVVQAELARHGVADTAGCWSDPDARFDAVHPVDLGAVVPLVGLPGRVLGHTAPVDEVAGLRVDQCFIGSCANGQLDDLATAASILQGRTVASGCRLIVTPASQAVYLEALRRGYVETLVRAGAVVTSSACGACFGYDLGVLGDGEVCVTSSTRNFKGRMGSSTADVYMASTATVAASAISGRLTDPRAVEVVW